MQLTVTLGHSLDSRCSARYQCTSLHAAMVTRRVKALFCADMSRRDRGPESDTPSEAPTLTPELLFKSCSRTSDPLFKPVSGTRSTADSNKATFSQPEDSSGLAVSNELQTALKDCEETVDRIARECRAKNTRFRDVEFDLENDRDICLNGLYPSQVKESPVNEEQDSAPSPLQLPQPPDVLRVTQIFDKPSFFVAGADSNDIVQGQLGNCWFLSALATMTTKKGLVEKFCVARHEDVGIYGFIFFRDDHWVSVIIDDQLFTSIAKYEDLHPSFQQYYHNDKEFYNKSARKGNHSITFAKSATDGETWVPLIEKAYAKLHGDYASLAGGFSTEAIEDLTGGISTFIKTKDIFDIDKFWTDELMNATKDRLFGCSFFGSDKFGLFGAHAYSVLRAKEVEGKRFLVIRNPWGKSEWTGAWSDGSKEWNAETFELLPMLEHSFGNDGQFVMEYSDFLKCWDEIERTLLLDEGCNWITSSHWLRVSARPLPSAWTYGDVCCRFISLFETASSSKLFTVTIKIPQKTSAIIVLSQLDSRYFKGISSPFEWMFDFKVFKRGQNLPLGESAQNRYFSRSVNLELVLEEGDYIVHVRFDRRPNDNYIKDCSNVDQRKLSRVRMAKAQSQSIASNFKKELNSENLGVPMEELAGLDFEDIQKKAAAASGTNTDATAPKVDTAPGQGVTDVIVHVTVKSDSEAATADSKENPTADSDKPAEEPSKEEKSPENDSGAKPDSTKTADVQPSQPVPAPVPPAVTTASTETPPAQKEPASGDDSEENVVFMGLRVYTDKNAGAAVIGGQLRREMEAALAKLVKTT
ncbi:cysteine proteinase [Favolaschia claudopus]|uniref:Cysteine proteinase n=1 Tax=Favolaschia claudopus TaxID=2862362 RepID=A0AAW0AXV8_9AGAR